MPPPRQRPPLDPAGFLGPSVILSPFSQRRAAPRVAAGRTRVPRRPRPSQARRTTNPLHTGEPLPVAWPNRREHATEAPGAAKMCQKTKRRCPKGEPMSLGSEKVRAPIEGCPKWYALHDNASRFARRSPRSSPNARPERLYNHNIWGSPRPLVPHLDRLRVYHAERLTCPITRGRQNTQYARAPSERRGGSQLALL